MAKNKQWYIDKYGEKEGTSRFILHVDSRRQSIEQYINRYGEDIGIMKWKKSIHQ